VSSPHVSPGAFHEPCPFQRSASISKLGLALRLAGESVAVLSGYSGAGGIRRAGQRAAETVKRLLEPEAVAEVAAFLLGPLGESSPECQSRWISAGRLGSSFARHPFERELLLRAFFSKRQRD
jgi:hypothetical protein